MLNENIGESAKYTANTGTATLSAANSNLDGTGTLETVLTGASSGTLVRKVTVKATGNTTAGIVRFFVTGGGATKLLIEIPVSAVTKSGTDNAFSATADLRYELQSGYLLKASTQNAEAFTVIAEGLDWTYPA